MVSCLYTNKSSSSYSLSCHNDFPEEKIKKKFFSLTLIMTRLFETLLDVDTYKGQTQGWYH